MMDERDKIRCDLSAYLDGELEPARRAEVAAALASDTDLSRELEQLSRVRELVADQPKLLAGDDFADDVLTRAKTSSAKERKGSPNFYRMAAAAGVVIVACGALLVSIINTTHTANEQPQEVSINQMTDSEKQLDVVDLDLDVDDEIAGRMNEIKERAKLGMKDLPEKLGDVSGTKTLLVPHEEIKSLVKKQEVALGAPMAKPAKYTFDATEADKKSRAITKLEPAPSGQPKPAPLSKSIIVGVGSTEAPAGGMMIAKDDAPAPAPKMAELKPEVSVVSEPELKVPAEPSLPATEQKIARVKPSMTPSEKVTTPAAVEETSVDSLTLLVPKVEKPESATPEKADKREIEKLRPVKESPCCMIATLAEKPKADTAKKAKTDSYFQTQLTQARKDNTAIIVTDDLKRDKARVEKLIVSNSIEIVPPAKPDEKLILNQARNILPQKSQQYEYVLFASSARLARLKEQIVKDFGSPENRSRSRALRNQLVQNFDLSQQLELKMPEGREKIVKGRGLSALKTSQPATKEVMIITIQAKSISPMMMPVSQPSE